MEYLEKIITRNLSKINIFFYSSNLASNAVVIENLKLGKLKK